MHGGFDISFDKLHETHKQCTPSQIMYYQLALNLHKTLSYCETELSFETISLLDQLICTRRQVNFQIHKECNIKIGLNTTANKFYPLNNRIGLCMLNMSFVPFKRAAKVLFLKYGKT